MVDNKRGSPGMAAASAKSLLGQLRKILRQNPVIEREEIRARLRASRQISQCGFGGRRVFHLLHYLRRRGEIVMTPTHVMAVRLLPAPLRKRKAVHRKTGPYVDRWKAAEKRARNVAKRANALS